MSTAAGNINLRSCTTVTVCHNHARLGITKIPDDRRLLANSRRPPDESKHKPAEASWTAMATLPRDLPGMASTPWLTRLQIASSGPLQGFLRPHGGNMGCPSRGIQARWQGSEVVREKPAGVLYKPHFHSRSGYFWNELAG